MTAVGGLGVLVVVAFVVAVALGGHSRQVPGQQVALVRADGVGGVAVLAGRCHDQRVASVTVTGADGRVRWRASSVDGAISRKWVVGGPAPVGSAVEVPLEGRLTGVVTAAVTFVGADGAETQDARTVTLPLPAGAPDLGAAAPPCGGKVDLGGTTLLFAAGAAAVVFGYGLMVGRWWRGRRR